MKRFAELLYRGVRISFWTAIAIALLNLTYRFISVDSVAQISDGIEPFLATLLSGALASAVIAWWIADFEACNRASEDAYRVKKEAASAALAAKAEHQKQESIAAEQRSLLQIVEGAVADAKKRAAELPKLAQAAERAIDTAEQEFSEGVFAPFWDAVETATTNLAEFEHIVQLLVQRSRDYKNATVKLHGPAPAFDLGFKVLPDATHASVRLKAIVRQAQKNPHFATIYELRKTNEILVEGFTNLGQALTEVGDRLENSMDTLRSSLTEGFAEVASSNQKASEELVAQMEQTREQSAKDSREEREMSAKDSEARRKHEREEREMLDNIQRRKKPGN